MNTTINLTFSASSLEAINGFVELVKDNVDLISYFHQGHEKMVKYGNGTMGSYWLGTMSLSVNTIQLNDCLIQIDSVKLGFVSDPEDVMASLFGDITVNVYVDGPSDGPVATGAQLNSYLHNKVQEQERALATMEVLTNAHEQKLDALEEEVQTLAAQYRNLQVWLRTYINVEKVAHIVRELAEQVDDSLLDDFEAKRVH